MTATPATPRRGDSRGSSTAASDPFHDPFDAPITLPTRPPIGRHSGDSRPNWDGTPAHSSGMRDCGTGEPVGDLWSQPGGVA